MGLSKSLRVLLIGAALIGHAGCGSSEPTLEERAAREERARVADQQRLTARVANFPAQASSVLIPGLEALTPGHVSDMQGAANVAQQFDRAALEIVAVKDAQAKSAAAPKPGVAAASSKLRAVLIRKQKQLYPVMRRTYAAYLSDATAGTQTNFRAVGQGGKTLRGASLSFTSQDAVMQVHYSVAGHAARFRFTKGEYVYSFSGERYDMPFHGDSDSAIRFED